MARARRVSRAAALAWTVDPRFALFWTNADASNRSVRVLHFMIAGWLLLPVGAWAYHEGPGQDGVQLDLVDAEA